MSLSPIVDARHRLRPDDLYNGALATTILNVTLQGVEAIRPVLHLAQAPKPLVLDAAQCNDIARITGSAVPNSWIGSEIVLNPNIRDDVLTIDIHAPGELLLSPRRGRVALRLTPGVRSLLIGILIVLLFLLVYQVEQSEFLWNELLQLLP